MRMTAESGDTRWEWRNTSMPSMVGILISVMMTSYSAPSILFFASCPACTVSTRCPSRRKEMSSISQIDRSSSHASVLATATSSGCGERASLVGRVLFGGDRPSCFEAVQAQYEGSSLRGLGPRPCLASMRLHNLVDDSQSEPGAALEVGLKGLEYFFNLLRTHACSGVRESNLPVLSERLEGDCEPATTFHGADGILAEIPKHLLDLVAIGDRPGLTGSEAAFYGDPGILRRHTMLHQRQRILDELHQVDFVEVILFGARISEEISDDAVQTLRLAGHNVEQAAVILVQFGDAGKHADGTGNRSQRIADFMGDGRGQPADSGQAILHPHFALQTPDFGEIVENVNVPQIAALRHRQGCHPNPNRLAEFRRRIETYLAVRLLRFHAG